MGVIGFTMSLQHPILLAGAAMQVASGLANGAT